LRAPGLETGGLQLAHHLVQRRIDQPLVRDGGQRRELLAAALRASLRHVGVHVPSEHRGGLAQVVEDPPRTEESLEESLAVGHGAPFLLVLRLPRRSYLLVRRSPPLYRDPPVPPSG